MKIFWGPAGEDPVIDAEYYTEGEWLLEQIKNDYTNNRRRPFRPIFFKSVFSNATKK
jgi:hypothetical protein